MRVCPALQLIGSGACLSFASAMAEQKVADTTKPDATLRISSVDLEISPAKIIKTIGYKRLSPGPFLRFREDQRVTIDVHNDTKDPEIVHWRGLFVPSEVDGSIEEGTSARQ